MKLIYTATARIPSEKAHPYQIVQMCEAFAGAGADVTLLYARRRNKPPLDTTDIWGFYGVGRTFEARALPVLDLYPLAARLPGRLSALLDLLATALVLLTFHVALLGRLARARDARLYSRNALTLALVAVLWPRRARLAIFEAHTYPATRASLWLRRWLVRRVAGVVAVTEHLRQRHEALGIPPARTLTAHDGIRAARFDIAGSRADWRRKLGWPGEAFVVGYMGRFQTLGMDKGVGDLVDAALRLMAEPGPPLRLALVGGPGSVVDGIRARVAAQGFSPEWVLYPGQVPPGDVPGYLRAFDVCAMPFPWTEHFAYYASPMKLFEYMASGSALLASDLPATAEIVRDGQNGLLVPPSDVNTLAAALRRLRDDPALRERLAAQAARDVVGYTWEARAVRIVRFMQEIAPGERGSSSR